MTRKQRHAHAPHATSQKHTAADGTRYVVYSDGSHRRRPRKLRGKAAVKAAKRSRVYRDGVRIVTVNL